MADLEDAVKKGILQWKLLSEELLDGKDSTVSAALERTKKILTAGSGSITENLHLNIGLVRHSQPKNLTVGCSNSVRNNESLDHPIPVE